MQLQIEHPFGWTPDTPPSAFWSAQRLPSTIIPCSFPPSEGYQEQQRPSKRQCSQPVCYDQGLLQSNDVEASHTTELTESLTATCHGAMLHSLSSPLKPPPFSITQSLQAHNRGCLESLSPTASSNAASDIIQDDLIPRCGDRVSDSASQGSHNHSAVVFQSWPSPPLACKPSGSGQTSLDAAVKGVGREEGLPPVGIENAGMGNGTYHRKAAAVGVKGIGLDALHRTPQDSSLLPSDFDLDSDMEDDMGKLIDGDSDTKPQHKPPLSVLEAMDRQSRDADEYRSRLWRSPQVSRDEGSNSKHSQGDSNEQDCDILDYEVDWDEVMASIKPDACTMHKPGPLQPVLQYGSTHNPMASSTGLAGMRNNRVVPISQLTASIGDSTVLSGAVSNTRVKATPSLSSVLYQATALRLCFRIGELLNQGSRCFRNEQRAVFELFARVTYSSRENHARVQHFQFADLDKDYPPFLSGTMKNWKLDSLLDRQARAFLGEGGPRLCRCTCQLRRGINTDTGWVISILSIRLSDRDEADSMKRMTV
ncbi:hypothetical protein PpBr36_07091 [Pyricularia pennisetigena]|uniref:hypothetical protein n=1 Tax=Pyricularia pennisetigena TaxID=1578925 RepID=UPI0011515961|nr:hypothetical protein PpBr36_07091 [Pyricularia pennisetigena]TLS25272.1 hypothetical protein PpBr36_07091 [Pyricularia pennisetigena]